MALDKAVKQDIAQRMGYHPANVDSAQSHDTARKVVIAATQKLVALPMDARHRSLVITNMEVALMWANKGIALGEQGSPVAKDGALVTSISGATPTPTASAPRRSASGS